MKKTFQNFLKLTTLIAFIIFLSVSCKKKEEWRPLDWSLTFINELSENRDLVLSVPMYDTSTGETDTVNVLLKSGEKHYIDYRDQASEQYEYRGGRRDVYFSYTTNKVNPDKTISDYKYVATGVIYLYYGENYFERITK